MHHPPKRWPRAAAGIAFATTLCAIATGCTPSNDPLAAAAPVRHRVDASTRFGHVAVFPAGTPAGAIEAWRAQVLARVHVAGCAHAHPCVARTLRLAAVGAARADVLAFDLATDIPADERAALLVAAARALPHAVLHDGTSPLRAAGD